MATIYIVEDDVNIREIERYALKNSGYEVEEFESGESLFKRRNPGPSYSGPAPDFLRMRIGLLCRRRAGGNDFKIYEAK